MFNIYPTHACRKFYLKCKKSTLGPKENAHENINILILKLPSSYSANRQVPSNNNYNWETSDICLGATSYL